MATVVVLQFGDRVLALVEMDVGVIDGGGIESIAASLRGVKVDEFSDEHIVNVNRGRAVSDVVDGSLHGSLRSDKVVLGTERRSMDRVSDMLLQQSLDTTGLSSSKQMAGTTRVLSLNGLSTDSLSNSSSAHYGSPDSVSESRSVEHERKLGSASNPASHIVRRKVGNSSGDADLARSQAHSLSRPSNTNLSQNAGNNVLSRDERRELVVSFVFSRSIHIFRVVNVWFSRVRAHWRYGIVK